MCGTIYMAFVVFVVATLSIGFSLASHERLLLTTVISCSQGKIKQLRFFGLRILPSGLFVFHFDGTATQKIV